MTDSSVILSVSQLNRYLKTMLDSDFTLQSLYISGEISNFTNHVRSGHYYMTLKDETAAVRAVMFAQSNRRLRFLPENGMRVLARGRVTVFERDGQYQLYIDDMQPDGVGALHLAFEQLKKRLEREGLFDAEKKRPLPAFPARIAVVTSPTGAVFQDIRNVLTRRWPSAKLLLCPVLVQGEGAAQQIARAVRQLNAAKAADVLIVGRGGGSLEDLWAFNEEILVRAIAASEIPVVSAVGHETDFTLCDFAADLRAPTPSAAAELATPDSAQLQQRLSALQAHSGSLLRGTLSRRKRELEQLETRLARQHPAQSLNNRREMVDKTEAALARAVNRSVQQKGQQLSALCGKLDALSPLKILQRGYAAVYRQNEPLTQGKSAAVGDTIAVQLHDATLSCTVNDISERENFNGE